YNHNFSAFKNDFSSYYFTDEETVIAMKKLYSDFNYIAEPHGAIGYLGLKNGMKDRANCIGVFLETAHPIKFSDTVEHSLKLKLSIPKQIESVLNKDKKSIKIKNYSDLKEFLNN